MRRGVVVILLVTVLAVIAVTVLLQPVRVQRSGPWRSVPLKVDDVHRLDALGSEVFVGGRDAGGGPLLAVVDRGEFERVDVPGDGGIWSQVVAPMVAVVVDAEASSAGPSGWFLSDPPGGGDGWRVDLEYEAVDRAGRRPDRLWLTEEDEGAAAVGGFLDEAGHLALVPLDWESGMTFADGPPGLYLAADASPADLWVGGTEGSYVVAGPVSDTPGATDTGLQVWTTNTMIEFPWTRVELEVLPDVLTDMRGWVLGLYLAGAAGQRPVVLGDHGRTLEVPEVALDPADPTVLLAEIPLDSDERPSVVLQTPGGAVLYRATSDGWDEVSLPSGHAEAAVLAWDDLDGPVTAYVVVDGTLWWRPLPALGP